MSNKKKFTALNKTVYLPQIDKFYKCSAVNEDGQPTKLLDGTINGLDVKVGDRWVVANTRTKVIQALLQALMYQNKVIDEQSIIIREQELEKQQLKTN